MRILEMDGLSALETVFLQLLPSFVLVSGALLRPPHRLVVCVRQGILTKTAAWTIEAGNAQHVREASTVEHVGNKVSARAFLAH